MTQAEKDAKFDSIFSEPLSDRKKEIPKDWSPPKKRKNESWREFIIRGDKYREEYKKTHKGKK